jgi:hypothetical protein
MDVLAGPLYESGQPGEALRFRLHLAPTVVELRRKQNSDADNQNLRELADFYPVTLRGSSVEIAVDRGRAAEAPTRIATILDDIYMAWGEHFHLPELSAPKP